MLSSYPQTDERNCFPELETLKLNFKEIEDVFKAALP